MVNVAVTYIVPEISQVVILLINQVIEMKGLDHHLLCPMQHHVNGAMIDEIPKFLASILSETMQAIQLENPFDATIPTITLLKLNRVAS